MVTIKNYQSMPHSQWFSHIWKKMWCLHDDVCNKIPLGRSAECRWQRPRDPGWFSLVLCEEPVVAWPVLHSDFARAATPHVSLLHFALFLSSALLLFSSLGPESQYEAKSGCLSLGLQLLPSVASEGLKWETQEKEH